MRPSHYSPVETALHLADELAEAASVRETRPGHLHSAIAGRALFGAIKADLTAFGRHLGLLLARWWRSKLIQGGKRTRTRAEGQGPRRTPVVVPFIKGVTMAALLGSLLLIGGILWALQERPGAPAQSDRPSLVLETADGRALGRTGPLIGAAARSDFLDVSASTTGGAYGRHGFAGCVDVNALHVVVLGALSTSAMRALFAARLPNDLRQKSSAEAGLKWKTGQLEEGLASISFTSLGL